MILVLTAWERSFPKEYRSVSTRSTSSRGTATSNLLSMEYASWKKKQKNNRGQFYPKLRHLWKHRSVFNLIFFVRPDIYFKKFSEKSRRNVSFDEIENIRSDYLLFIFFQIFSNFFKLFFTSTGPRVMSILISFCRISSRAAIALLTSSRSLIGRLSLLLKSETYCVISSIQSRYLWFILWPNKSFQAFISTDRAILKDSIERGVYEQQQNTHGSS